MRVNALFFTGFGFSAVMGVVFNNTIVPSLGWDAMFIILGSFSLVSFIMLLFFAPIRSTFIPFDDTVDEMGQIDVIKMHSKSQKYQVNEGSLKNPLLRD